MKFLLYDVLILFRPALAVCAIIITATACTSPVLDQITAMPEPDRTQTHPAEENERSLDAPSTPPAPGTTPSPQLSSTSTADMPQAENMPDAFVQEGDKFLAEGELVDAINSYSLSIRYSPSPDKAYYGRSRAYNALGNTQQAEDDIRRAIELNKQNADYLVWLARLLLSTSEHDEALVALDRAERIDEANGDVYFVRGLIYRDRDLATGAVDPAVMELDKAILLLPNRADVIYERGVLYAAVGLWEQALVDMNVALNLDPDYADAYYLRAQLHSALNQFELAVIDYEKAISLGLDNSISWMNLGLAYLSAGQTTSSLDSLRQAVKLNESDEKARYWLAFALLEAGNAFEASVEASYILNTSPDNMPVLTLRALSYVRQRRWQAALDDYQVAYELDGSYIAAMLGMAEVYIRQGKYDQAKQALENYLSLSPASDVNRPAIEAFLAALSSDPGSVDASALSPSMPLDSLP